MAGVGIIRSRHPALLVCSASGAILFIHYAGAIVLRRVGPYVRAQQNQTETSQGAIVTKTRGQVEAEISEAIVTFEREYMGRGPEEAKAHILGDLVLVRLSGVLTPAEKKLSETDQDGKGRLLIKQLRTELLEKGRPLLDAVVRDITGRDVTSLHTDISTITGERIIIFVLEGDALASGDAGPWS